MSDEESPVEVPYESLDEATLRRVVAEFVSRDGTDYGAQSVSMDAKIEQVLGQLRSGKAAIVVDSETGSVNIIVRESLGS